MKTSVKIMLIGATAGLSLGCWRAGADLEVSASVAIHSPAQFDQPLSGFGVWLDVGRFGRCWHPSHIARAWRPYCVGQWEWTDCGWYWQSEEPWAWACYHYGSWVDDPSYGWIWVPGTEWAPAWVNWRESDDYIGWAPCGPPGFSVPPSEFVFVGAPRFCDPIRPSRVIVNNTRIIERTRLVSDFRRETRTIDGVSRRVIVNQGPPLDLVQNATHKSLRPVPVREVAQRTPMPRTLAPTGTERQRVFQEPAQNRSNRERQPVVQGRPQPPRDLRVVPTPNQPRTSAPQSPTGRQPERVYPREPSRPQAKERPVPPPVQPERSPGQEQRVYPPAKGTLPPTQHTAPTPQRPPMPAQPPPSQPPGRPERDQQRQDR